MSEELWRELALLKEFGYTHLDVTGGLPPAPSNGQAPSRGGQAPSRGGQAPSPVRTDPEERTGEAPVLHSSAEIEELAVIASGCTKCRLAGTRTQVVFGVGDPNADLMFIGEAPGRDEDLQGEPFVGRAGQLLTDIIKAMKLSRQQVYIANVIKCRPPENRNPEPDELDACRPYIRRQVELIQPKVIVTLGKFGLQSLTEKAYSISSVRGSWLEYNGIRVMPTYHPAYLLRTPAAKKDVWSDMKKVMIELGIPV